jgi:biotin-(acetyl-CoA carboxylase) ligase
MSAYRWTCEWARGHRVSTIAELETTSTNLRAKEDLEIQGPRTALYIADHQTLGRGRGTNQWSDLPGQALLSSWVFPCEKPPQPIFSFKVGLALFEAAKATWPKINFALKAPNDLHVIDQNNVAFKVAGLLIEVVSLKDGKSAAIIGLGLNTHGAPQGTTPFPATCLTKECAKTDHPLCEADFRTFLTNWLAAASKMAVSADTALLTTQEAQALKSAMAHHPIAQGLARVTPEGSLIFDGGKTVSWTEL